MYKEKEGSDLLGDVIVLYTCTCTASCLLVLYVHVQCI